MKDAQFGMRVHWTLFIKIRGTSLSGYNKVVQVYVYHILSTRLTSNSAYNVWYSHVQNNKRVPKLTMVSQQIRKIETG